MFLLDQRSFGMSHFQPAFQAQAVELHQTIKLRHQGDGNLFRWIYLLGC